MTETEKNIGENLSLEPSSSEVVVPQDEKLPENFDFEEFYNSIKVDWGSKTDSIKNLVLKEKLRKTVTENPKMYEVLKDSYIISVENDTDGHYLSEGYGVRLAADILRKNQNAKIILASFLNLDILNNTLKSGKTIFDNPNVYFMLLPELDFNSVTFGEASEEKYLNTRKEMLLEFVRNARHKASNSKERFYKDGNEAAKDLYTMFNEKFGDLFPNYSYDEFVEFCINGHIDIDENSKEKMPGQEITGVYCDMDGTLIITDENGEKIVNEKVLKYLKNLEKLGKKIHIRTGGNLSEQKQVLEKFGITYPLFSKYDYSGATAEIIIDDMEKNKFEGFTSIKSKVYVNVNDIPG